MPQSSFAFKIIATPCRAKISKSQTPKGKMPLMTYLLLCSCLYQELKDTYFFGNICPFRTEFWSWECLSALLMPALPSGAWTQRAQKKLSETEENATCVLYLLQRHHHICTYFISSKILLCLYKQKRRGSLLCCEHYVHGKASGGWCS